jgi:gamma-glutamyltranspeptidase / glutathione hydrolase
MSVVTGRSRIATRYGIVAASQPLAAQAGVQVLEGGGNAVDAAIAANAVMGLVEPQSNGIGGDLFAIVYDATSGELHGLNACGWAPGGLTRALIRSQGYDQMPPRGVHSITVPGAVAGWDAMRSKFGALSMADLLAPAIFYAEHGFPVSDVIAGRWAAWHDKLAADSYARRVYLPQGRAPSAGEIFRNPDLAAAYRRIADQGGAGFYEGPTADAILRSVQRLGGTMTASDLKDFAPEWVAPISTTYRSWTVYELPPNTQGIAALMMLDLMERFPLREYGFHSARALHVMIEAKKLAYADMLRHVGDTRFGAVPVSAMIDKSLAAERATAIDASSAAADVRASTFDGITTAKGGDTIYLAAIDKAGNIVSLIQSIYEGFGSGIAAGGAGFMLQNRGSLFSLEDGHPNVLAPRKRPLHTIIPGFMRRDRVAIGFGIMGGWNQAQAHAQFVANVVDYDMDIQQALEAGRFTKPTFGGRDVLIEALVPETVRGELVALGHEVTVVPPRTGTFGSGQAVMSRGDVHFGASEPRHDGAAIPEAPPVFDTSRSTSPDHS